MLCRRVGAMHLGMNTAEVSCVWKDSTLICPVTGDNNF